MSGVIKDIELMMPIKAAPYEHQKRAFAFACEIFGVFSEEGDGSGIDKDNLRPVREGFSEKPDGIA